MKTYKFHFNTKYAADLRDAVNDRQKQSLDNVHNTKGIKGSYYAWSRTCAAMDRLEDTLSYLNTLELGKNRDARSAFDFYDFINNTFIVIDCIKTIGNIFKVDDELIKKVETSTDIFNNEYGTAQRFFEYIRALCSVHPLCTNRQKEFLRDSKFHCCPFVTWKNAFSCGSDKNADLIAYIYPTNADEIIRLDLYVSQFEKYLTTWIEFIPEIINAKNTYTDNEYEKLRSEPVKNLSDFRNDIVQYLLYLKGEYIKRLDYGCDFIFDYYAFFFTIKLSDDCNNVALEKYKNAILYSLSFTKNELQNMSYEGYENNGIKHPDSWIDTTLFDLLHDFSVYDSSFSKYGYNLQKLYHLAPDSTYNEYDKIYARHLLEEPKELINQYIHFTNTESDAERFVLVKLALYLEALSRKSLLNKNIPNTLEYRIHVLPEEQYAELIAEENENITPQAVFNIDDFSIC